MQFDFKNRCARLQMAMQAMGVGAVLFTTAAEFFYFCGFRTPFWQSLTRQWYLIVLPTGAPVAVIPNIGERLMSRCYVQKIYTWQSPHPTDEGIGLLSSVLKEAGAAGQCVGVWQGAHSYNRMSLADFTRLQQQLLDTEWVDIAKEVLAIRQVKTAAEVHLIEGVCGRVCDAFDDIKNWLQVGMSERAVHQRFKIECLRRGVEDVPYLVGGVGQQGYDDIICLPTARPLAAGDLLMMDVGAVIDGYFCDFSRHFAIGHGQPEWELAHHTLWQTTDAALQVARAGVTCADVFAAMAEVIGKAGYAVDASRYGHGVGIELTEAPSITSWDTTLLKAGMVLAIEPSLTLSNGAVMVHEENIVITEEGNRLLTRRTSPTLPVIAV